MGKVRKGFEDCFYSGMLNGKLVQGKLGELDEAILEQIAQTSPDQQMIIPTGTKQIIAPIEDNNPPVKPEAPKQSK